MKRRNFLKLSVSIPILSQGSLQARENHAAADDAIGLLYDATLCINCQSCVSACKYVNDMAPEKISTASVEPSSPLASIDADVSSRTLSVVQQHQIIHTERQLPASVSSSFLKKQCMHCIDPSCVSACPVSAMKKDKVTGIVSYDAQKCIGCRYCVAACPFGIPQFEFEQTFGKIQKCQMCNQSGLSRIDQGKLPACAEVCPVGATVYGPRKALLTEAKKRLTLAPGKVYDYPLKQLGSGEHNRKKSTAYYQHLYGEHEGGGTQVLYLAAVPFEQLPLPALAPKSAAARTETLQQQMTGVLPLALLSGLLMLSHRHRDKFSQEDKEHKRNKGKNSHD